MSQWCTELSDSLPLSQSMKKTKPNNILQFKIKDDAAESFESHLNYTGIKQQSIDVVVSPLSSNSTK